MEKKCFREWRLPDDVKGMKSKLCSPCPEEHFQASHKRKIKGPMSTSVDKGVFQVPHGRR